MSVANIDRRETIERAYPREAFAQDAARNAQPASAVLFGVLVLSAPNAGGDFELDRASRHVGENPGPTFLAPQRRERPTDTPADSPPPAAAPEAGDEYALFVADIIAVARQFGFDPGHSPGAGDPRLRGLRQ